MTPPGSQVRCSEHADYGCILNIGTGCIVPQAPRFLQPRRTEASTKDRSRTRPSLNRQPLTAGKHLRVTARMHHGPRPVARGRVRHEIEGSGLCVHRILNCALLSGLCNVAAVRYVCLNYHGYKMPCQRELEGRACRYQRRRNAHRCVRAPACRQQTGSARGRRGARAALRKT